MSHADIATSPFPRAASASSPQVSLADLDDDSRELLRTLGPLSRSGKIWVTALLLITLFGAYAYSVQLRRGLIATAMNDYFSWGVYIINFVFFIGISMAGTLISAMLRLTGAQWRRPITRLAEAITLLALLVAAPMVIIDMGRPDRFWHVLVYGRLQSPILWDVLSLNTYMAGSFLYLYLPMIPDLAMLRDQSDRMHFPQWRRILYRVLSLGWKGSTDQRHRLERAVSVMAVIIIPVAISIHTVTSWIFGMTLRPGWHSTIIGPDFVVGALYSGVAAVITAIALFRKCFHLEHFLTPMHFQRLSMLLLIFGLTYLYFLINEYLGPGYALEQTERRLLYSIIKGPYALPFYIVAICGLALPLTLLMLPWTRTVKGIVTASVFVNVGMWVKRWVIIVPTLNTTYVPPWKGTLAAYRPTWVELAISLGALAAFCLLYTLFAKIFPIVSIWEVQEGHHLHAPARGGPQ